MSALNVALESERKSEYEKYLNMIWINGVKYDLEDIGFRKMGILMVLQQNKELTRFEVMDKFEKLFDEPLCSQTAAENLDKLVAANIISQISRENFDKKKGKLVGYQKGRPPYYYYIEKKK